MGIQALIDDYIAALREVGAQSPFKDWAQFEPATDAELEALSAEIGCDLTDELTAWLRHLSCALPFEGNYEALPASGIMARIPGTREIDFSQHHANITSWEDGRFDSGQLANVYWQPQWVAIARDGCGNEYCVDLAPGPNGEKGQLIAMEFQDGQGPYLAQWPTLEAMLTAHVARLAAGDYELDDEGFIEYW